jgi:uncharacterized protein with ATP-grasp and redox domains
VKTYLECIPCFFKQALEAARRAGASTKAQRRILERVAREIPRISLETSPPEMGRVVYGTVNRITGKSDPYKAIKAFSNKRALLLYPTLKKKIARSRDRLRTAVELAIAGNIIDYGVKNSLCVERELAKILKQEKRTLKSEKTSLFAYQAFRKSVRQAKLILYLADNAGETVFDKMLIEEIRQLGEEKRIVYAVKERPIINDALVEDARACGIDRIAEVISSGSAIPGTVLSDCSRSFLDIYRRADMIISKGQGNFESFDGGKDEIYFLFMAKCPVVAEDVGCTIGDIILLGSGKRRKRRTRNDRLGYTRTDPKG